MPHPAMSPNHVAVITGGASGIGLAAAMQFASLGMKVCIADLGAERLAEAKVGYLPLIDIPRMGEIAQRLVQAAVSAIACRDADAAHAASALDDELDILYKEAQRELRARLLEEPQNVPLISHLLFVTHYLERIGD